MGGKYSNELWLRENIVHITNRKQALKEIREWLNVYEVKKLFAYNASFDKKHLPEYSEYEWYDIMRLAAYRQYNWAIQDSADCFKTGKLKRRFGVEDVLKMLSKNKKYSEAHNAVLDAQDELEIMRLLGHKIQEYEIAFISDKKISATNSQQGSTEIVREAADNSNRRKGILSKIFGTKK